MKKLVSTNPAKNYEVIGSVIISTEEDVKNKVKNAGEAKKLWKDTELEKRVELLKPLYADFLKRKTEIAHLVTKEIGKPISESLNDMEWDEGYFKSFLNDGIKYLKDTITYKNNGSLDKIIYEPIGIAASIVPWNFPWGNFLWGVIPNLIAGNTVVFKHSEECPLSGQLYEKMMNKLNLPKGVFSEVYGDGKVGEMLVNQNVDLVWFTGSSKVGKYLYKIAGAKMIKAVFEMGGSNPAIIFDDIDPNEIVNKLYTKRYFNCGQVCDSVKRLIVHESIFDKTIQSIKKVIETKKIGDPEDRKTDLGSLVAKRQLELLEDQVKDAIKKGAKIITGGKRPNNLKGAYYLPTILINIKKDMRVWKEETFGPVLVAVPFKTEEEAIESANDTEYGLGAQIYSQDKKRAFRVASKIQAGTIDINYGNHWKTCNPFGGYKSSGMGREHGESGFRELCQLKVVASG